MNYGLEEALDLLAALEEARDALIVTDHLAEAAQVEHQVQLLSRRLASMNREARMVEDQPLRAAQAARKLGIPTKELLRLVYERKIRYVMVDGIAHVPIDAVEEYRSKAS